MEELVQPLTPIYPLFGITNDFSLDFSDVKRDTSYNILQISPHVVLLELAILPF